MKRSRTVVNGLVVVSFVVACLGVLEAFALNIGQTNPFSSGYRLRVDLSNADGLPLAAAVRAAGVTVGRVVGVDHDPAQPAITRVTIELTDPRAEPVYEDACAATQAGGPQGAAAGQGGTATVRAKSLLGDKYVDLTVGSPTRQAIASGGQIGQECTTRPLPSGGELSTAQTGTDVNVDEIFRAFDAKTRGQSQQVLAALDQATAGRAGDIAHLLPQLTVAVQNLVPVAQVYGGDATELDQIVQNLGVTLQSLSDENQAIGSFLRNGNVALGTIASRDQSLVRTLQEASTVSQQLTSALAPTVPQQRQALAQLSPTLDSLNALFDGIQGPHCGGRSCGIAELFTGTLTGNIHYPNDQLTVSTDVGALDTQEWASMFSSPASGYATPGPADSPSKTHSALNLTLSLQCSQLNDQLTGLLGSAAAQLGQLLQTACNGLTGNPAAGAHAPAATSGYAAPAAPLWRLGTPP